MKNHHLLKPLQVLTLLAVAGLLAVGCATPKNGYQQAEKTGDVMAALRKDITTIQASIDATSTALDEVTTTSATDPRKAFSRFAKAVDTLEAADTKAKQRADDMREEGRLFFARWESEIAQVQNPEVQSLAKQRREELDKTFRNISRVTVQVKDELNPWISDVRDLHTFLSNDLTPAGINMIQPVIDRTTERAIVVKESLEVLIHELNIVETAITPVGKTAKAKDTP